MCNLRPFILSFTILNSNVLHFVSTMPEVQVELQAPRYVEHGHGAVLRCKHSVNHEYLDKVVFFKHGHRIMQFIKGRDPPFIIYNITGAEINVEKLTPTSITLDRMNFSASGHYACEIALDSPLYSKVSKMHEITVIVRQKHRPKIKIKTKKSFPDAILEATCHSAAAYPAPHLTWFINNTKVDERYTTPHGTSVHRHQVGVVLSATNLSLRFPLSELHLELNQTVKVSCVSTIPGYISDLNTGYADIQNHTISLNMVRMGPSPTQLPVKSISLQGQTSGTTTVVTDIIISIFLMYLLYLLS